MSTGSVNFDEAARASAAAAGDSPLAPDQRSRCYRHHDEACAKIPARRATLVAMTDRSRPPRRARPGASPDIRRVTQIDPETTLGLWIGLVKIKFPWLCRRRPRAPEHRRRRGRCRRYACDSGAPRQKSRRRSARPPSRTGGCAPARIWSRHRGGDQVHQNPPWSASGAASRVPASSASCRSRCGALASAARCWSRIAATKCSSGATRLERISAQQASTERIEPARTSAPPGFAARSRSGRHGRAPAGSRRSWRGVNAAADGVRRSSARVARPAEQQQAEAVQMVEQRRQLLQ